MNLNPAANRPLLYLLLGAGLIALLHALAPILSPFLFALGLAYLFDPLVDRLERRRCSRTLGTLLVMFGMLLALVLLLLILTPLVQAQVRLLVTQIPLVLEWGQDTLLPWLSSQFGLDLQQDRAQLIAGLRGPLGELAQLTAYLPQVGSGGLALLGTLASLLLVPVVTFYLLRDWDRGVAALVSWLPVEIRERSVQIGREIDAVLAEFLRGQLAVMAIMAVFYSLALWLVGLNNALAVGLIAGILVFVPYLGVVVGVLLGSLAALAQHGELLALLPVWGVFLIGQLLEGFLVTPWLVGERIGLHPVAVIFALLAFGQLFGFFGVLLALPASAALLVGLRHLKTHLG